MSEKNRILGRVNDYYSRKVIEHGATPGGVDWNSEAGQVLRFQKLIEIVDRGGSFSLCDFGCGYGAMAEVVLSAFPECRYTGIDVSSDMIFEAKKRSLPQSEFLVSSELTGRFDYIVASGVFNVKLDIELPEWESYIYQNLCNFYQACEKGFALNFLSTYSDPEFRKERLFYADPLHFFDFVKRNISKKVSVLHDYELYEFTLLVRK
jgi:cyclopropane fatty-acyl-phospholipid synthase-like methyltransferase